VRQQLHAAEGGHEAHPFEFELEFAVASGHAGDRRLDHRDRLARVLSSRAARPHQGQRRPRALLGVERRL
jgi:hypothetical protein